MQSHFQLVPEAVGFAQAGDKSAALALLADKFEKAYGHGQSPVFDALEMREKLGSTGFGRGAAIPHARVKNVERPIAALIKLAEPVDFGATDKLPVGLMIGLLSPPDGGAAHLQALASISRALRDDDIINQLQGARDREALLAVVTNLWEQDAA